MARIDRSETTRTLSRSAHGDRRAAEQLIPHVYEQLRRLAAGYLSTERPDHTLQPTALVHEAYLRLVDRENMDWKGKTHFLAVAATEMRRVLIHHARARKAQKRDGGRAKVSLDESFLPARDQGVDVLDLADALEKHSSLYPRQARVVELRYFGGLNVADVAEVLGVSDKSVEKDWRMARAWLHRQLKETGV